MAESVLSLPYSPIRNDNCSEAFLLQNVEACNFLSLLKSQHLISGISVGPTTLWYLEEPLEI